MKRILMVCLGNICRSPLAEGILASKVDNSYFIDSAGTAGYHIDSPPDSRSIDIAKKHGIDISNQRCRQLKTEDFDNFDKIFVMDSSNYQNVIKLARNQYDKDKVSLIMNELNPELNQSVPDPYYGADNGFEKVFEMLDKATDAFLEKIN